MFRDRTDAGHLLAEMVASALGGPSRPPGAADGLVVGLPRGGVPVAALVAESLGLPLDVLVVRKIGVPLQPELALGAVGESGAVVLNDGLVSASGVGRHELDALIRKASHEVEDIVADLRPAAGPPDVTGRMVIVVDDGVATGGTAVAALRSVRLRGAGCVVLAVPVAPGPALPRLRSEADGVVVVATPSPFVAVGQWYRDFDQVPDEAVVRMLSEAAATGSRS